MAPVCPGASGPLYNLGCRKTLLPTKRRRHQNERPHSPFSFQGRGRRPCRVGAVPDAMGDLSEIGGYRCAGAQRGGRGPARRAGGYRHAVRVRRHCLRRRRADEGGVVRDQGKALSRHRPVGTRARTCREKSRGRPLRGGARPSRFRHGPHQAPNPPMPRGAGCRFTTSRPGASATCSRRSVVRHRRS